MKAIDNSEKKIKEGTINGTTDAVGNVIVALSTQNRVVVTVMLDSAVICFPFMYATGDTYAHVTSTDGLTPKTNTAVTGTYYYLDK